MAVHHGLERIADKRYVNPARDWVEIKRRLPSRYAAVLSAMDGCIDERLAVMNGEIIRQLAQRLGLRCSVVDAPAVPGNATERLVGICKALQCEEYLSGPSGKNYMEEWRFAAAGIKVLYPDISGEDRRSVLEVLA